MASHTHRYMLEESPANHWTSLICGGSSSHHSFEANGGYLAQTVSTRNRTAQTFTVVCGTEIGTAVEYRNIEVQACQRDHLAGAASRQSKSRRRRLRMDIQQGWLSLQGETRLWVDRAPSRSAGGFICDSGRPKYTAGPVEDCSRPIRSLDVGMNKLRGKSQTSARG